MDVSLRNSFPLFSYQGLYSGYSSEADFVNLDVHAINRTFKVKHNSKTRKVQSNMFVAKSVCYLGKSMRVKACNFDVDVLLKQVLTKLLSYGTPDANVA